MDTDYTDLFTTLKWMWQGILLLFICCGFIAAITFGLGKLAKLKKKKPEIK